PVTTPIIQYSRRARIAQSYALPTVADEHASLVKDFSEGEACPTESGFIADQDRATIVNLQRQYSKLQAKFQAQEEEIVKLKDRVKVLEDRDGVAAKQSRDDAPIKGRTTVLAGGIDVPIGSGFIPTTGPPTTVISTGSEVGPTAIARELEEQQEKEDMKMNEQIARDTEVARIHAEEELQGMIDSLDKSNETIAKYLQEYQDFALELPLEKRVELISDLNFMHAPVEWKLYDLSGVHHLTAKDKEIFMLVEKDYPLRKGLALVMISYKLQVQCSHWQYKFPLPVKVVATARRLEMPLPEVCTAIEEKKKKLPVKDRWQLH
nr:hypothetical protein [Tanacetum cinerariifolium]